MTTKPPPPPDLELPSRHPGAPGLSVCLQGRCRWGLCPPGLQSPIHRPADPCLLPGWGHETPPRADLEAKLHMLLRSKHIKSSSQREVFFGSPYSGVRRLLLPASLQHKDAQDPTAATEQNSSDGERARQALQVHSTSPPSSSAGASRPQGARTPLCLTPFPLSRTMRRSSFPAPERHPESGERAGPGVLQGQPWRTAFPSSFAPSSPWKISFSASLPTPPTTAREGGGHVIRSHRLSPTT